MITLPIVLSSTLLRTPDRPGHSRTISIARNSHDHWRYTRIPDYLSESLWSGDFLPRGVWTGTRFGNIYRVLLQTLILTYYYYATYYYQRLFEWKTYQIPRTLKRTHHSLSFQWLWQRFKGQWSSSLFNCPDGSISMQEMSHRRKYTHSHKPIER